MFLKKKAFPNREACCSIVYRQVCARISLFLSLRTLVLCHYHNRSAGEMESARAFTVLLKAEFQCDWPRLDILEGLYEQVAELVSEERLDWAILCGSGFLASIVEFAVT